jgi:translation elongation factor EF-4
MYGGWLRQVVTDFFDEMKSRSRGYASMEYHVTGYRRNDLVRLDVKINNEVTGHRHMGMPALGCMHSSLAGKCSV